MFDLTHAQHTAQQLGYLDRCRTHQYRTACFDHLDYFFDDGIVFLALGAIDTVVHIDTGDRLVGRDNDYIELVDVPELACLGLGCTGHTAQLVVHTEVVLERDGRKSLGSSLDLDVLLGLDSLVESV